MVISGVFILRTWGAAPSGEEDPGGAGIKPALQRWGVVVRLGIAVEAEGEPSEDGEHA